MRPSPTESATGFEAGTERKGNDGTTWVVAVAKNGVRRWVRPKKLPDEVERCLREFVRYERPTSSGYNVLQGRGFERDGRRYVLQHQDDGGGIEELVEEGFRRKPVSREFVLDHFCKVPVDGARLKAAGAIDAWTWCDLAVKKRKLALTIADVLRLKVGESVKLLLLHRNWADVTLEEPTNKRGHAYDPKRFFRKERVTFRKVKEISTTNPVDEPLSGQLKWDNAHVNMKTFEMTDFELLHKGWWSPLDERGFHQRVHWTRFPRNTPVGWRGYAIPWARLADMPKVFWQ